MHIRNVLCDRDGTLIIDKHYLSNPDGVELLPTVYEGIALLRAHGLFLALISNQSGIGRGYFTHSDVDACNDTLSALLAPSTPFDAIRYCPHAPEENCVCRKPNLGMWHSLQQEYGLYAGESVMVGDKSEDIEFALQAFFPYAFLMYTGKGKSIIDALNIVIDNTCIDITDSFMEYHDITMTGHTTIYASPSFIAVAQHICELLS